MSIRSRVASGLIIAILLCLFGGSMAYAEEIVLRMAVPDWPPTRIMKDLGISTIARPAVIK